MMMLFYSLIREFAKSRAKRAYVIYVPTCLRASVVYVPTCLRAGAVYVPTCQKRANFSFLLASVPMNLPTCHTACQYFNLACQRAKRCARFSSFPLTKFYGKFLCFILDVIVMHICIMMYRT